MRELIADNPLLLMAMSRFGISLGFAEKTVGQICQEQQVDAPTFLAVANFLSHGTVDIDSVAVKPMMSYLAHAHSYFLDFCLPRIRRSLIEAIDCSGRDEVALLILKFYDEYTVEVSRHMEYENNRVFTYVNGLLDGETDEDFSIAVFASGHHGIDSKLKELKDIIIRYLPQKENNLLNSVLFDIINCEQDLVNHCQAEDKLFVPAVERLERQLKDTAPARPTAEGAAEDADSQLSPREKEIIACVAQGLSNKEIADRLCISINTVTTHRRNLAQKLQIHSSAGLAIYAVVNGIVSLDSLK